MFRYFSIVLTLFCLYACASTSDDYEGEAALSYTSVKVSQLTSSLTQSLFEVLEDAKDKELQIKAVKITLNTVLTDKKEGALSVLVFEGGGSKKNIDTTTFVVTLEEIEEVSSVTSTSKIDNFVAALQELVENADKYTIGTLKTSEIRGTLKFAVEATKTAGVGEEWEVVPIGLSAAQTISDAYAHTIEITFKRVHEKRPKAD